MRAPYLALPLCLAAIAVPYSSLLAWGVAQCIHCLWPFKSDIAQQLQERAWASWSNEKNGSAPPAVPGLEVPEIEPTSTTCDRMRPFVVRGLLNGTAAIDTYGDFRWLTTPPVGDLSIDYFSDATVEEGIVPDAKTTVADVVTKIAAGGPQKIGTEMIFRKFPSLLSELGVSERLAPLLGTCPRGSNPRAVAVRR